MMNDDDNDDDDSCNDVDEDGLSPICLIVAAAAANKCNIKTLAYSLMEAIV